MNETELLFTEILNCNRLFLYLNKESSLTRDELTLISSVLKRRIKGEPIQYILGKTEFMGLEFKVSPAVFIPRQETEILVETALRIVSQLAGLRQMAGLSQRRHLPVWPLEILDIGTGSGCIAIALAKFLDNANITATDISQKALEVAKYNANLNNISERIKFVKSDLFMNNELRTVNYELILSNPPYIPTLEIANLQAEISYQPRIASDGGSDGLDFYRRIIDTAPDYLKEEGLLIMEMGYGQVEAIRNIFKISGKFEIIEVVKDYYNIDRVVVAEKLKNHG